MFARVSPSMIDEVETLLANEVVPKGQRWDSVPSILMGAYTRQGAGSRGPAKQARRRAGSTPASSSTGSRSCRCTQTGSTRPVGVVGLYVDDILAGADKNICQGLMKWVKGIWNTGQVEFAGPEDPNTIRFLGMNLDYITKKQSSSDQPEGGVTIN
eukprot:2005950-Amphidinium_carterae.1